MGRITGRPTGVRLTKRQSDSVRDNIQATQIINRLVKNTNGELDPVITYDDYAKWIEKWADKIPEEAAKELDKCFDKQAMSPSQVRSAEILLNKSLPNLQATELTTVPHEAKEACDYSDQELAEAIAAEGNVTPIKQ